MFEYWWTCTDACGLAWEWGRRFHGQVNVIMIDRHLWDRYDQAADEAS